MNQPAETERRCNMKFCKYCGKKLGDDEVCSCPEARAEFDRIHSPATPSQPPEQPRPTPPQGRFDIPTQPPQQPQPSRPAQPQGGFNPPPRPPEPPRPTPPQGGFNPPPHPPIHDDPYAGGHARRPGFGSVLLEHFVGFFRAPAETCVDMVRRPSYGESAIFMGAQAVTAGLIAIIFFAQVNSFLGMFGMPRGMSFSLIGAFLLTAVLSFVLSALTGLLYFAFVRAFKGRLNFKQAVSVVSVRSLAVACVNIICCVLALFNSGIGLAAFFIFGALVSACYLSSGANAAPRLSMNRSLYLSVILVALRVILMLIFILVFARFYLPGYIRSELGDFSIQEFIYQMFMHR